MSRQGVDAVQSAGAGEHVAAPAGHLPRPGRARLPRVQTRGQGGLQVAITYINPLLCLPSNNISRLAVNAVKREAGDLEQGEEDVRVWAHLFR